MILDAILHVSWRVALLFAVLVGLAATLGGCASLTPMQRAVLYCNPVTDAAR